MDSNETIRPLTEVPVEQTSETLVSSSATAEENNATYVPKQTKEEVIERLKEINEDACNADKQELDLLKQNFYKLHKAEQEAARKAFIDGGGAPEATYPGKKHKVDKMYFDGNRAISLLHKNTDIDQLGKFSSKDITEKNLNNKKLVRKKKFFNPNMTFTPDEWDKTPSPDNLNGFYMPNRQ